MDTSTIYDTVNARYSSLAASAAATSESRTRRSDHVHAHDDADEKLAHIASSFGYSASELAGLPKGTNLGVSCGNPLATANLQPWETMLDLGSGGGLDCLIAARRMVNAVGSGANGGMPTGRIYGVDRSEDMIRLARRNVAIASTTTSSSSERPIPADLIHFVHAPITHIPLPSASVDLITSNCVINLVPDVDKPLVFREMWRLLKGRGGRVAISDILAKRKLPEHIRRDAALLVGCVAGASTVEQYRDWMVEAGFDEGGLVFVETGSDLNVYRDMEADVDRGCCGVKQEQKQEGEVEGAGGEGDSISNDAAAGGGGAAACCNGERGDLTSTTSNSRGGGGEDIIDLNEWVASYQIYAVK